MKVKILPKEKCLSISKKIYEIEGYRTTETLSDLELLFAIPDYIFNEIWKVEKKVGENLMLENLYAIPVYFIDWSYEDETN